MIALYVCFFIKVFERGERGRVEEVQNGPTMFHFGTRNPPLTSHRFVALFLTFLLIFFSIFYFTLSSD